MMGGVEVYYNEHDPKAAAWLRELMARDLIPRGVVDERDIRSISADEMRTYRTVHLFAGIGGWAYALRLAGWPDDRPVWTGSCPCQPFSSAGRRKGKDDARHLWPDMLRLVRECRPAIVFGEQVASKDGRGWLAGVRVDLEGLGYAVGAADLCAAGVGAPGEGRILRGGEVAYERITVGAPHVRQRLFWVANPIGVGCERRADAGGPDCEGSPVGCQGVPDAQRCGVSGELADAANARRLRGEDPGASGSDAGEREAAQGRRAAGLCEPQRSVATGGTAGVVGDTGSEHDQYKPGRLPAAEGAGAGRGDSGPTSTSPTSGVAHPASWGRAKTDPFSRRAATGVGVSIPSGGFWSEFDLIPCRDGKARRVEPGTFPLADGIPGRVGLLRGYGNAIVPQVAAEFVRAYCEAVG